MNVGSAGPLVCMGLDALSGRKGIGIDRGGQWLAWKSVQLACLGAVFGLLMGWLRWDPEYAAVLRRFASRITWGIAEFVFSVALLAAYAAWLTARPQANFAGRCGRSFLALLAATNLLYHFPPLFTLIANGVAGRNQPAIVDSPAFRKLIATSEVLSLTAHFALASVAVAGVMLLVFGWRQSVVHPDDSRTVTCGGRIALTATLAQIPVGFWLLLSVPSHAQRQLLGGDPIVSAFFVASMVAVFSLLHHLAAVSFGDTSRPALRRAVITLLLVVIGMTAVLQRFNQ